jgi:hypothetical protein
MPRTPYGVVNEATLIRGEDLDVSKICADTYALFQQYKKREEQMRKMFGVSPPPKGYKWEPNQQHFSQLLCQLFGSKKAEASEEEWANAGKVSSALMERTEDFQKQVDKEARSFLDLEAQEEADPRKKSKKASAAAAATRRRSRKIAASASTGSAAPASSSARQRRISDPSRQIGYMIAVRCTSPWRCFSNSVIFRCCILL